MNLKRQLLLVSLLTLVLPWAGCEFIRKTETALRTSQQQMLSGTARAVAESLARYPEEFPPPPGADHLYGDQIFGHRLDIEPTIDGYFDDWPIDVDSLRTMRGVDGPIRFAIGLHGRFAFLYAEVADRNVVFATPSTAALDDGPEYADRIILVSANPPIPSESIVFAAEAPGPVVAYVRTTFGFAADPAIKARWQDVPGGYQVEARIPVQPLGTHLGLTVVNTSSDSNAGVRSSSFASPIPGPFVTTLPYLTNIAGGLVQTGMRMIVTDRSGWRIAVVGDQASPPTLRQARCPAGCASPTTRSWSPVRNRHSPSPTRAGANNSPTSPRHWRVMVEQAGFVASKAARQLLQWPNPYGAVARR